MCISSPSYGLIVARRMVFSGGGGTGRPLFRALGAGAQVLLLRASAGGDSGGGGGGGASLLLKVCDDDSHIAHRYSELLSRAPVHILQFRSEVYRGMEKEGITHQLYYCSIHCVKTISITIVHPKINI